MMKSSKNRVFHSENTDLCENVVHLRLSNKTSNRPFTELLPVFKAVFPYYLYYTVCLIATCILGIICR